MPKKKDRNLPLEEYVKFLYNFGYLESELKDPDFESEELEEELPTDLTDINSFEDERLVAATAVFQKSDKNIAILKEMTGEPLLADGIAGNATLLASKLPRCRYKGNTTTAPALGTGGWKGCHGFTDGHKLIVDVDTRNLPSFLAPVFKQILTNVQLAEAEIGLWVIFREQSTGIDLVTGGKAESGTANTVMSFTVGNGWIGLAILGNGSNQTCSSKIWLKLDYRYQPANLIREWTTLILHELGHNKGLDHSYGGIMNSSIVNGLPPTWKGDPSFNTLVRWFSGVKVNLPKSPKDPDKPPTPPDKTPVGSPLSEPFKLASGEYGVIIKVPSLDF